MPVAARQHRIGRWPASVKSIRPSPAGRSAAKVANICGWLTSYSTSFNVSSISPSGGGVVRLVRVALFTIPIRTPDGTPWPDTSTR